MGIAAKVFGTPLGKRAQGRLRLRLEAKLITLGKTHVALLQDVSRKGAKLQLEAPPKPGSDAVLKWEGYETFGTITWVTGNRCGMAFSSPLPETTLQATRTLYEVAPAPAEAGTDREAAKAWAEGSSGFGFD